MSDSEDFWEDLLAAIEDGKVIPVLGAQAALMEDGTPLYSWMARKLAEALGTEKSLRLPDSPTLEQVAAAWLLAGGQSGILYRRLYRLLRDEPPAPNALLKDLASVGGFNLYITTTFDRMMERAINETRFGGSERTSVHSFWPEAAEKDLPARKSKLPGVSLYHLMGRVAASPEFAVWEEDALEFVCALHQQMPVLPHLARDLKEHALLVLGMNFSDWLLRFFLRVTKQGRLSENRSVSEVLATSPLDARPAVPTDPGIFYFGGLTKNIQIVQGDVSTFIAELVRRWRKLHPQAEVPKAHEQAAPMPDGAIFLSYAREDEAAVLPLKTRLEAQGCRVWYDRERLLPGYKWSDLLKDEVSERCSLFVSMISRTTEGTSEAYYHRERAWAAERASGFAPGEVFYVPVIIDDSSFDFKREPRVAKEHQGTLCPAGLPPEEFCKHLRSIQLRRTGF